MSHMVQAPENYFGQWLPPRSELLRSLEAEAESEQIPIVGPVLGSLLYLLARASKARHILELGTATGYSAIFLANACRQTNGQVLTLETDVAMIQRARKNISSAGFQDVIQVRGGDALAIIETLNGPVDLIFLDIDKSDYLKALPGCKRLLAPEGLLIADNTGFKDAQPFNQAIWDDPELEKINLWTYLPGHSPVFDGICLAMKAPVAAA